MLEPGVIPAGEPQISVGILLPEDRYTSVELCLPAETDYQLEFSGRFFLLEPGKDFFFKLSGSTIAFRLNNKEYQATGSIKIFPIKSQTLPQPQSGIQVKNVISGRGFHWKKYIHVTLPGTIILQSYKQHLLLINELPLEHYLMCVATSEMGAACPPALIEAQTIAARSWMLANVEQKHRHLGIDVCNDDCCQRYQGSTFLTEQSISGALNTFGRVLMYKNALCDARYSKSCGGVMEAFETIWGGSGHPYLQVKADAAEEPAEWEKPLSKAEHFSKWVNSSPYTFCSPSVIPEKDLKKYLGSVDERGHYFRWQEEITQQALTANINRFYSIAAKTVIKIEVVQRGGSGRAKKITVHYLDKNDRLQKLDIADEFAIRRSLHKKFLYSSAFIVEAEGSGAGGIPQRFILKGAGWGHGVGLCQIGALGMALQGYSTKDILLHYYPGSRLQNIYVMEKA